MMTTSCSSVKQCCPHHALCNTCHSSNSAKGASHGSFVFMQVEALLYPRCRLTCAVSAIMHTDKGAVSLQTLLGYSIQLHDASYMQQELETLVAAINRHLSHVNQAPVSLQNDSHPSVFATTVLSGNIAMKAAEQDALLCEQQDAVRAVNFPLGGNWVSIDKIDATTARLSTVSLSPMHAFVASETLNSGRDVSVPTMRARFLCLLVPNVCHISMLYATVMFIVAYWAVMFAYSSVGSSRMYTNVLPYWCLALYLCMWGADMLGSSVRAVAGLEISPDGRFWKIERSLTSPPFQNGAPLERYAMWWTRVVAEGSMDDLQGCEVGTSHRENQSCLESSACVMLLSPVVA
jgi:hypothetical protein